MARDPKNSDGLNLQNLHEITNSKAALVVVNGNVEAKASGGCPGSPVGRSSTLNSMRNKACGLGPRKRKNPCGLGPRKRKNPCGLGPRKRKNLFN